MPAATDTLRECHRLRRHLRDLRAEIERGPRVLKARKAALEAERQEHKDHFDTITKLKLKQRDDEGTLKQTEMRLAKLGAQLTGISVQKEYDAKQSEIRQAKEKQDELEGAILTTIGEIEARTAAIPAVEQKWKDAQAAFAEYEKEAAERLERLAADQVASREALAKAEATLPEDVKAKYDTLVKAHGPEAIAAVKGKACQGCRMTINEQRLMEIRNGSAVACTSCGKLLYPAD
jgi:predicted  nucleic acid-binding Zn-ribbon protein